MDRDVKACIFGGLIVAVYVVHQVTVGGDGVVVAAVLAALAGAGGYVLGRVRDGNR